MSKNIKVAKLGRRFAIYIETKTSQVGNDYEAVSICQSVKTKDGQWEKKYLNMFPDDLMQLIAVGQSALNDYIHQNTNATLNGANNSNNSAPATSQVTAQPSSPVEDDYEDEIPF